MLSKRNQSGVTLIELVIGVAIVAILMGLAAPSFQTWLQNAQIRTATESIQNGLQRARAEAVTRNLNVEFVLGTASSWTIRIPSSGDVIETSPSSEGSANVSHTVDPVGASTVTFNSFGRVDTNADASATLTQAELFSSALANAKKLNVTIGVGGNIRVCDPGVATSSALAC